MKTSTLLVVILLVGIALVGILSNCATPQRVVDKALYDAKWERFLECSADEGDLGCDSCFYATFGYHVEDAGYLNYNPMK